MQIVIDIPEHVYEEVKQFADLLDYKGIISTLYNSVANGTSLPKGHGRLIDADKMIFYVLNLPKEQNGYSKVYSEANIEHFIRMQDTIIEADKENKV